MDTSVGQTIERIKMQEHDNEIKLREKREMSNAVLSINRAIRDTLTQLGKLSKEYENLTLATDKLSNQLIVVQTRHTALIEQVNSCCKELEELREASNDGISTVWNKRSKLLKNIQEIANKCDIWALLIKPTCNEQLPPIITHVQQNSEKHYTDDSKLRNTIDRRNKALAERDYLISEPETGEEFIRIKNALQYSMDRM